MEGSYINIRARKVETIDSIGWTPSKSQTASTTATTPRSRGIILKRDEWDAYSAPFTLDAALPVLPALAYNTSLSPNSAALYFPASFPAPPGADFEAYIGDREAPDVRSALGNVDVGSVKECAGCWVRYNLFRASSAACIIQDNTTTC